MGFFQGQFISRLFFFIIGMFYITIHAEHPRLFFSDSQIQQLRIKAQTTHAEIVQPVLTYAKSLIGSKPPDYPATPDENAFKLSGTMLIPMAFAYIITGDTAYAALVRTYLLAYNTWPTWGGGISFEERDLSLAFMMTGYAVAYDWVYDQLPASDRVAARTKLGYHAKQMHEAATTHWQQAWNNWWGWSYAQNHWHINNNSLALAAFALEGETDSASVWLAHCIRQFSIDSVTLEGVRDGSWHESIQYQNARLTLSLPVYYNLIRLKNRNLLPATYLKNFVYWSLYNFLPGTNRSALTFSSYVPTWGEGIVWGIQGILRFVAGTYRDPYAEWLTRQIIQISGRYANVYNAPWYVFEFFYYDPSITSKPPDDLPPAMTFPDIGCALWRTGWGSADIVFGLKCGAYGGAYFRDRFLSKQYPFNDTNSMVQVNVGHDQPDAATFYLYKGKLDLASEMPDRHRLGTAFHNTVLVDNKEQYQAVSHGAIAKNTDGNLETVQTAPDFCFLLADATNRYREKKSDNEPGDRMISEFTRNVLFVKPSYLVMVDHIRSDQKHRYDWICHASDDTSVNSISVDDTWIKAIAANKADILGIKVVSPAPFIDTIGLSVPQNYARKKPYIRIRPSEIIDNIRFITVLFPTTATAWANKPDISIIENNDSGAGLMVLFDGSTHIHCITYNPGFKAGIKDYALSAQAATILKNSSGVVTKLFLCNGDTLSDSNGSRFLVQSPRRITVEAVYTDPALKLFGEKLQGMRIFGPGIAENSISVNGIKVPAKKSGDYIVVGEYLGINGQKGKVAPHVTVFNPARGFPLTARIDCIPGQSGRLILRIYSMQGRNVFHREKQVSAGKRYSFDWYRTPSGGITTVAGCYILSLQGAGIHFVKKLTVSF
jgi:hypothetical protein